MLNPFPALFRHYNPFRSPIETHRCADGLTVELRSPLRSHYSYSLHACDLDRGEQQPLPCVRLRFGDREVALFASDTCLSISHKAPRAYYRDEIRVWQWRDAPCDAREPEHAKWSGAWWRVIGPISFTADTAARQERDLEAYRRRKANAPAVA
jgi:hypothetical protein